MKRNEIDTRLTYSLFLGELFDLSLYRELREFASPEVRWMLSNLISVEEKHVAFWKKLSHAEEGRLSLGQRIKLLLIVLACRILGDSAIHLVLEAIEVYGVRKYLRVWEQYKRDPMGRAVRRVLEDEFDHEDQIVTRMKARLISPERIRNIFLGFNDGLVEILGAVSGLFAAFDHVTSVIIAGFTVAVAGSLSMAAGAFVASSSEHEVKRLEEGKSSFLGIKSVQDVSAGGPLNAAAVVGIAYFLGSMIPIFPVIMGAHSVFVPLVSGGVLTICMSMIVAFLSGMDVRKRILMNLVIIAGAVGVTYGLGTAMKMIWGISL